MAERCFLAIVTATGVGRSQLSLTDWSLSTFVYQLRDQHWTDVLSHFLVMPGPRSERDGFPFHSPFPSPSPFQTFSSTSWTYHGRASLRRRWRHHRNLQFGRH